MTCILPVSPLAIRLAVGDPAGPYSASLRVWSPAGRSDVYAGVRERSGEFKIALHGSGECHAGLTWEFAESQAAVISSIGGSKHQSRWIRRTHVGSQLETPLQFVFPASELRTWRNRPFEDKKLSWLPAPSEGHSVIVTCGFSGQMLQNENWPGRSNHTHLLATKVLPNGEKLWLLWQECPTGEVERAMLAEASSLIRGGRMIRFEGVAAADALPPRVMIFKEFPETRTLIALDAAAT